MVSNSCKYITHFVFHISTYVLITVKERFYLTLNERVNQNIYLIELGVPEGER